MGGLSGRSFGILLGVFAAVLAALWFFVWAPPAPQVAAPAAPQVDAPATPAAPVADAVTEPAARQAPRLDVVRLDPSGMTTVAGRAEAGARVSLRVDDIEAAFAEADASGNFATLFTLPASDTPRILSALSRAPDGHEEMGADRIVLSPATDTLAASALKIDEETDAAVLMNAADIDNITIDSVAYEGQIIRVSGRGAAGAMVRLYLGNAEIAAAEIGPDGAFTAALSGVAAGDHTLRADQLDSAGKVTSRYEMQITKADPQALAAAASAPAVVEVAVGTTLWAIAEAELGDGLLYVQVYEANKDKIRDPNLIYPGQVFEIPKQP